MRLETVPLGQLCSVSNGKSDTKDAIEHGEYAFFDRSRTIKKSSRYLFDCEALIIPGEGTEFLPRQFSGKFDLHQRAYALFDFSDLVGIRYLYYYLHHVRDYFPRVAVGATVKSLRMRHFEQLPVVLMSVPEQHRIVTLLDEAFAGIATAKANAEKCLRNSRELLAIQVSRILSASGDGWAERSLVEICVVDWGNTSLTKSSYIEDGKYLAVSAAGCDGRIAHMEHSKHTPVLSAIGAQCGRMFFPDEDFTAIKNTITLTPREGICLGRFLFHLLNHVELPKRGAAQPFMAKGDIQAFRVLVPSRLDEQKIIAGQIDALEAEAMRLESLYTRKLAALDELKQSLLQRAFSGQL